MSSVEVLIFIHVSMKFFLASFFAASMLDRIHSVSVSVWGFGVVLGNFSFSLRDYFLTFRLACTEASNPIYLMS